MITARGFLARVIHDARPRRFAEASGLPSMQTGRRDPDGLQAETTAAAASNREPEPAVATRPTAASSAGEADRSVTDSRAERRHQGITPPEPVSQPAADNPGIRPEDTSTASPSPDRGADGREKGSRAAAAHSQPPGGQNRPEPDADPARETAAPQPKAAEQQARHLQAENPTRRSYPGRDASADPSSLTAARPVPDMTAARQAGFDATASAVTAIENAGPGYAPIPAKVRAVNTAAPGHRGRSAESRSAQAETAQPPPNNRDAHASVRIDQVDILVSESPPRRRAANTGVNRDSSHASRHYLRRL